jgi:hypothetical protein
MLEGPEQLEAFLRDPAFADWPDKLAATATPKDKDIAKVKSILAHFGAAFHATRVQRAYRELVHAYTVAAAEGCRLEPEALLGFYRTTGADMGAAREFVDTLYSRSIGRPRVAPLRRRKPQLRDVWAFSDLPGLERLSSSSAEMTPESWMRQRLLAMVLGRIRRTDPPHAMWGMTVFQDSNSYIALDKAYEREVAAGHTASVYHLLHSHDLPELDLRFVNAVRSEVQGDEQHWSALWRRWQERVPEYAKLMQALMAQGVSRKDASMLANTALAIGQATRFSETVPAIVGGDGQLANAILTHGGVIEDNGLGGASKGSAYQRAPGGFIRDLGGARFRMVVLPGSDGLNDHRKFRDTIEFNQPGDLVNFLSAHPAAREVIQLATMNDNVLPCRIDRIIVDGDNIRVLFAESAD